jgi:hypothetical protein
MAQKLLTASKVALTPIIRKKRVSKKRGPLLSQAFSSHILTTAQTQAAPTTY